MKLIHFRKYVCFFTLLLRWSLNFLIHLHLNFSQYKWEMLIANDFAIGGDARVSCLFWYPTSKDSFWGSIPCRCNPEIFYLFIYFTKTVVVVSKEILDWYDNKLKETSSLLPSREPKPCYSWVQEVMRLLEQRAKISVPKTYRPEDASIREMQEKVDFLCKPFDLWPLLNT